MIKLAVILPAAGTGSRMRSETPKPYLRLKGTTILEHTIRNFLRVDSLVQIVIATSNPWMSQGNSIASSFKSDSLSVDVVEGGSERQFSIHHALQSLDDQVNMVAVHDAVRPFITTSLVELCCSEARDHGGAIVAVPAKDTIKRVDVKGFIQETPKRSAIWQAQTPQIFQRPLLERAYKKAIAEDYFGTDDASLVERIGGKVKVIAGDRRNLKITFPIDLRVAEMILEEGSFDVPQ